VTETRRPTHPLVIGAVFGGGVLGTSLRLGIDAALPHPDDGLPVSTLLINVMGSFVLGLLVARVWPTAPHWLRAGLGTGVLGSFTTFSAIAVSLVTLRDDLLLAALYLGLTLVLGFGAAAAGVALGSKPRPSAPAPPIGADE